MAILVVFFFFSYYQEVETRGAAILVCLVIAVEGFSILINKTVECGYLLGFKSKGGGREKMLSSHLLFADEALVFCGDFTNQMVHLKSILILFEALSGLCINLKKSEIIPIGGVDSVLLS